MSHNRTHIISKIAVTVLAASIGLIALPGVASAATAQSTTTAAEAKTAPGQPKFGESGARVTAVQAAIARNGFTLKANGVFDKRTRTVLRNFQRVVGLPVTGLVDVATVKVLKLDVAQSTTTLAPTTTVAATTTLAPTTTTTVAAKNYAFTVATLPVRGNKGDNVVTVQKALVAAGFAVKGGVDGMFGSGTTSTITAFQSKRGITATGVLDQTTASALGLVAPASVATPVQEKSVAAPKSLISVLPVRGNKNNDVRIVQNALVAAGISIKGGVDGVFGGATTIALQKYQAANGLNVSGIVDSATAIKLGVISAPAVQLSVFPVQGLCSFVNTWHAPRGGGRLHLGVDIIAKEGNLLYAVADGTISKLYSTATDKLAGNGVRITMDNGTYFFYGHMSRLADGIAKGTKVKAGQVIGYVGHTGDTNTPHLHFEIHPNGGEAIDPTAAVDAINGCGNTTPLAAPAN